MPWWQQVETPERMLNAVEYNLRHWLSSPLLQRWLGLQAMYSEARLAAAISELRASSLLIGAADLGLTLAVPVGVWVGVFAALGAPYLQARALVIEENFLSGFSHGFVMGLLSWGWNHIISRFGRFTPGQRNYFDESLTYYAANSYNHGLQAGYYHSGLLSAKAKKLMLKRLRQLSRGTTPGRWSRLDQIAYVVELAAAARRNNIFRES